MPCPSCHAQLADGAVECPACGIIVAKWRPRTEPGGTRAVPARGPVRSRRVGAAIGAVAVAGATAIWWFAVRPKPADDLAVVQHPKVVEPVPATGEFDRAYPLSSSILGLATDGRELVAGIRSGGLMRLRFAGDRLEVERVRVLEPVYDQGISVNALTFNGRQYVGIAMADWFQQKGTVFTVHDPKTLALITTHPAPPSVGCLAWDGRHYWAATRKNTREEKIEALLYKLDASMKVAGSWPAPGPGCQGMAWDGRLLWLADVFDDTLTLLDPSSDPPRVVNSTETRISYLSGIAWLDRQMWLTEYGQDRLVRLRPELRASLAREPAPREQLASLVITAGSTGPQLTDRRTRSSADRAVDDAEVLDQSIELRDDAVYGSWRIWFGPELFVPREQTSLITIPQFARYTVTVETPSGQEIEKEFDGSPGEHVMDNVRLCDAREAGEYAVSIFIHVQFVSAEGGAMILNRSNFALRVRR